MDDEEDAAPVADMPVGTRYRFALGHLRTAALMAHHCRQLENEFVAAGPILPSRRVQSYAVAAITESVAFLESAANELWQYAIDNDAGTNPHLFGLPPGTIDQLRRIGKYDRVERSLTILDKYDLVLMCAGRPKLDNRGSPHRDVKLLITLRNALVHYRPERQWSNQLHKLQQPMTDLGLRNPLHEGLLPWFPGYPLCASVAEWSWTRCRELVLQWQNALGLTHASKLPIPNYVGGVAPDVSSPD